MTHLQSGKMFVISLSLASKECCCCCCDSLTLLLSHQILSLLHRILVDYYSVVECSVIDVDDDR